VKNLKGKKPPLNVGRIIGEILAGVATGIATGLAGAFIGLFVGGFVNALGVHAEEWAAGVILPYAMGGTLIAYTLGCPIGVYLLGKRGNKTGSFLATIAGSILGTVTWLCVFYIGPLVIARFIMIIARFIMIVGLPILPLGGPIGATIGFNLTRRYKLPPAS